MAKEEQTGDKLFDLEYCLNMVIWQNRVALGLEPEEAEHNFKLRIFEGNPKLRAQYEKLCMAPPRDCSQQLI